MHVVCTIIEYFNEYGSSVYLSAQNISKVYDRLNHCAILLKMKHVGVPVDIIMVFWYCLRHFIVAENLCNVLTESFDIKKWGAARKCSFMLDI